MTVDNKHTYKVCTHHKRSDDVKLWDYTPQI